MQNLFLIPPTNTELVYMGRFNEKNPQEYICSFPGSSITIQSNAKEIYAKLQDYAFDSANPNYIAIIVDGILTREFPLEAKSTSYVIFENPDNQFHTIEIYKRTESLVGNIGFQGFLISEKSQVKNVELPAKKILFVGNSITCGYGNEAANENEKFSSKTENAYMSFASITSRAIHCQYHLIAYSGKGIYRNWEDTIFNIETMPFIFERTTAYDTKTKWNHSNYIPNIIVLNIGTNDFSPPLGADKNLYIEAYTHFLQRLQSLYPEAAIICTNSQMLKDPDRTNQIDWIQEAILQLNNSHLYFCTLSMQGALGYGADWHPNIAQNNINAQELLNFISLKGL